MRKLWRYAGTSKVITENIIQIEDYNEIKRRKRRRKHELVGIFYS